MGPCNCMMRDHGPTKRRYNVNVENVEFSVIQTYTHTHTESKNEVKAVEFDFESSEIV